MNVLVFNCGSSSLKYKLISMPSEEVLAGGEAQRVGPPTAEPACIYHQAFGQKSQHRVDMPDHQTALKRVMSLLTCNTRLVPQVMGHRMVHGGSYFSEPMPIDENVMELLEKVKHMAPIHNPPATALIRICHTLYPNLPQVVVFDTAYHATLPDYARTYALPLQLREEWGYRKYGFHGTSHQYVAEETAEFLGKPLRELDAVSCHLGSGGASLCAILNGRSVDNTMGYSPLQGLVMSTRCGDLDPAITLRLLSESGGDGEKVEKLLNNRSGVLGLSQHSADIRDVLARISEPVWKQTQLDLTAQVYVWRIRKYLGAYLAVVGRADAVIFTDTIGETVPWVRNGVCAGMEAFGLKIDPERNRCVNGYPADIAAVDSPVRIVVVQTNEELAIARRTYSLLADTKPVSATEV